ncbi:MAG: ABC transporter permease [Spirochaetota bacterium]|nr:MAG: ABC transporter permease [Spirochaetota bacterium]
MQVAVSKRLQRSPQHIRSLFERFGIYIFLAILIVTASLVSPNFLKPQNLKDILNQSAALGMVAIGQTFVILIGGGGLDLSVASVMSTVAVIMAHNTEGQNSLFIPVMGVCLLFGIIVGFINGTLITKRKVQPFMATLGMMIIVQGIRFLYTKGMPKGEFPPIQRYLATGDIGSVPTSIISLAVMVIIALFVLRKTTFGRKVYAIGGNVNTARLCGYNIDFTIISVYMISGFMASIAGLYLAGWIGISDNWVGKGYELDSIAAVVMGGTTFEGGRGGVLGTIVGVLIVMMLYNIVLLLGMPVQMQFVVKGVVIILATSFYASFRRTQT